jgi:hypothetical protein
VGREHRANRLTQSADDHRKQKEHPRGLVVGDDQSASWSRAVFDNAQRSLNLIAIEVHHDPLPKPSRWKAGIVARGVKGVCQTTEPEIHGHEADFTSLSRQ